MIDSRFYEDDIIKQFTDNRIIFTNMRCLDIGSRDGLNCITLVNFGAREVVGIDIDDSRFSEMEVNDKITLVKVDLLDYYDDEKFDVITCFLWNMSILIYHKIMIKIKSLLKPNGKIYIGFHDDLYKYDK
jgi:2-polyprenyl-3-methyl-5-hydroxy-6-metoxy-1,4-benzoquinol methylase